MQFISVLTIFTATVVIGSSSGIQVPIWRCDPSIFMSCTMPVMMYFMGPEGQQRSQKGGLDLTESQFNSLCGVIKPSLTCIKEQMGNCMPSNITDIHETLAGLSKLAGQLCDRPGMYNKFRTFAQCSKTINQSAITQPVMGCLEGSSSFLEMGPAEAFNTDDRNRIEAMWSNGRFMKSLCCEINQQKGCLSTIFAGHCDSAAKRVADDVLAEISATFQCSGPRAENCPTRTETAETGGYESVNGFGQMFAGGGMGQVTAASSNGYDPYAQDKERNQAGGHGSSTDGSPDRDHQNTVDPSAYATTTEIGWLVRYGDRDTQDQSVSGVSGYNPYARGRESASGSSASAYDPYNRGTADRQPATPDPYQYPETSTAGYDSYGSVTASPYDPYAHYRTNAPNYDNYETTTQNPYDNSYYQSQAPNDNYGSRYGNNYDPYRRYQTTTVNYRNTPGYDRQDPYGSRYQTTTQNYWSNRNYGGQAEASTQSPYQYDRYTTASYYGGDNYDNQNAYTTASPYSYYTTANPNNAYGNQYQTMPPYNNQRYGSGYGTGGGSSYSSYGNGHYAATTPVPTCIMYNPVNDNNGNTGSNGNSGGNGGYSQPSSIAGESCCTFYRNGMTCQECTTINGGLFVRRTSCSSSLSSGKN